MEEIKVTGKPIVFYFEKDAINDKIT